MAFLNIVIDVSHHNNVTSFHDIKASGIVGVIHKATQGVGNEDPEYAQRKVRALSVGLLWGAYHFTTKGNPIAQANHFLEVVNPGPTDLMVLDWEPDPRTGDMTLTDAEAFVRHIHSETGRYPVLYSGESFLRSKLGSRTASQTILSKCPLWLAKYSTTAPTPPPAFADYAIWQYTDGALGPQPHQVPGIGRCDRDKVKISEAELKRLWGV